MNTSKIIKAYIRDGTYSTTEPITQGDYGYILQIEGTELPPVYRVDFSNDRHKGEALPVYGNENGVEVPEELIATGKDIFAFYFYIKENFGKTAYTWKIPNDTRAQNGDIVPTPTQQDSIDQLVVRSNEAVERAEQAKVDAETAQGKAEDAQEAAEAAERNAEQSAIASAQSAEASARCSSDAQESAEEAGQFTQRAEAAQQETTELVAEAQRYVDAAGSAAEAAETFANNAYGYARSASESADTASTKAGEASESANTASEKASEASGYASTASAKASESAQSASNAQGYAQTAESAKTDAQTAKTQAETARDEATTAKTGAESARDEAQSLVDGISGKVEQIDSNTERIESLEDDRYKPYAVDSASGAIASFVDGADDIPLKSLVVDVNPVQDLHGQDAPYPAGGGKNLFDQDTVYGEYKQSDGSFLMTGLNGIRFYIPQELVGKKLTFSAYLKIPSDSTLTNTRVAVNVDGTASNGNFVSTSEYTRSVKTFTPVSTDDRVYITYGSNGSQLLQAKDIQLEIGSIATDFEPYENICPISGWTEVGVEQSGVNVWDEEWESGTYTSVDGTPSASANAIRSKNFISVIPDTTYAVLNKTANASVRLYFHNENEEFISYLAVNAVNNIAAFTTPSNCKKLHFAVGNSIVPVTTYANNISINYPSTDHDYHPYTGRSITIDLGQTVYGAKLYPLGGKAVVDSGILDLSTRQALRSGYDWRYNFGTVQDMQYTPATSDGIMCTHYKASTASWSTYKGPCIMINTRGIILADDRFVNDPRGLESWLDEEKVAGRIPYFVYPLANPIEIQLDSHTLNSLYGQNNLWADSGNTEVVYRADTKLFIERLTSPDSADMVADANITSGKYFMVGNSLYKATANIANGSAIIVGTNCIRKSLSEALNEINA